MSNEQNKTKHTPGPWTINARDKDQRRITITASYDELRSVPLSGGCLGIYFRHGEPGTVEEANARLIAAAPDMLEALERAPIKLMQQSPEDFLQDYKEWFRTIRNAAIAKAEGQEKP